MDQPVDRPTSARSAALSTVRDWPLSSTAMRIQASRPPAVSQIQSARRASGGSISDSRLYVPPDVTKYRPGSTKPAKLSASSLPTVGEHSELSNSDNTRGLMTTLRQQRPGSGHHNPRQYQRQQQYQQLRQGKVSPQTRSQALTDSIMLGQTASRPPPPPIRRKPVPVLGEITEDDDGISVHTVKVSDDKPPTQSAYHAIDPNASEFVRTHSMRDRLNRFFNGRSSTRHSNVNDGEVSGAHVGRVRSSSFGSRLIKRSNSEPDTHADVELDSGDLAILVSQMDLSADQRVTGLLARQTTSDETIKPSKTTQQQDSQVTTTANSSSELDRQVAKQPRGMRRPDQLPREQPRPSSTQHEAVVKQQAHQDHDFDGIDADHDELPDSPASMYPLASEASSSALLGNNTRGSSIVNHNGSGPIAQRNKTDTPTIGQTLWPIKEKITIRANVHGGLDIYSADNQLLYIARYQPVVPGQGEKGAKPQIAMFPVDRSKTPAFIVDRSIGDATEHLYGPRHKHLSQMVLLRGVAPLSFECRRASSLRPVPCFDVIPARIAAIQEEQRLLQHAQAAAAQSRASLPPPGRPRQQAAFSQRQDASLFAMPKGDTPQASEAGSVVFSHACVASSIAAAGLATAQPDPPSEYHYQHRRPALSRADPSLYSATGGALTLSGQAGTGSPADSRTTLNGQAPSPHKSTAEVAYARANLQSHEFTRGSPGGVQHARLSHIPTRADETARLRAARLSALFEDVQYAGEAEDIATDRQRAAQSKVQALIDTPPAAAPHTFSRTSRAVGTAGSRSGTWTTTTNDTGVPLDRLRLAWKRTSDAGLGGTKLVDLDDGEVLAYFIPRAAASRRRPSPLNTRSSTTCHSTPSPAAKHDAHLRGLWKAAAQVERNDALETEGLVRGKVIAEIKLQGTGLRMAKLITAAAIATRLSPDLS
ncbi:hypothetical protein PYCC9005_001813 [Savitreella phatthalungensis]